MTIQIKRSYTSGRVPLSTELLEGQLFINLPDQEIYSKNNTGLIVCIGNVSSGASAVSIGYYETSVATVASQTLYPISNIIGLQVFVNGLKLVPPQYSLSYPNIILANPSTAGDTLVTTNYGASAGYSEQSFTGDGVTTTFNITNPYKAGTSQVYINGLRQPAASFTATDGRTLNFTTAPSAGAIVAFTNINPTPLTTWHISNQYVKDQAVYYQGVLYYAQSNIAANTSWSVGTSNNQWSTNP